MGTLLRGAAARLLSVLLSVSLGLGPSLRALPAMAEPLPQELTADAGQPENVSSEASPTVVRELQERRTATSKHFLLSDGAIKSEFFIDPVHWKDASGTWRAVDERLVPDEVPGSYKTAAGQTRLEIGSESNGRAAARVESDGWSAELDVLGASENAKLVLGNTARFMRIAPDTDLEYVSTGDGVKETIVLHSASAPDTFTFALRLTGAEVRRAPDGTYGLYATDGSNRRVASIGDLIVFDSGKGEEGPAYCDEAVMDVAPSFEGATISYRLPRTWLDDPLRTYPVMVDPTLTTTNTTDTFVAQAHPNNSYGSLTSVEEGYSGGSVRGLMKFDISSIPSTAYVRSSNFKFYQYHWAPTNGGSGSATLNIGKNTSDFGNSTTWYTKPTLTTIGSVSSSANGAWLDFSCPSLTQDWVDGSETNYGFYLWQSDSTTYRKFRSSEYSGTTYDPRMVVIWSNPGSTGTGVNKTSVREGETISATLQINTSLPEDINALYVQLRDAQGVERGKFRWSKVEQAIGPNDPTWEESTECPGAAGGWVCMSKSNGRQYVGDWSAYEWYTAGETVKVTFTYTVPLNYTASADLSDNKLEWYLRMGPTNSTNTFSRGWVTDNDRWTVLNDDPPVASASATPTSGVAPLTVNFDATSSSDDVGITSYAWDFESNGTTDSTTAEPVHTYSIPGIYTWKLTVKDRSDQSRIATGQVTVTADQPPVAAASASPTAGIAPLVVQFDSSASTDDVGISGRAWDFDNNGSTDSTAPAPSHTYSTPGLRTWSLTVTDTAGQSSTCTGTVNVTSAPAVSMQVQPQAIVVGESALLSWDVTGAESVSMSGIGPVLSSGTLAVSPTTDTTYTITATNQWATTEQSVHLSVNVPPSASFTASPGTGPAPLVVDFDASGSADFDGSIAEYSWDFDANGSTDATGLVAQHEFPARGTYDVGLRVVDDEGAAGVSTQTVVVTSPLPSVTATATPSSILLGEQATLSWTSTDAETVTIEPGIGAVASGGSVAVSPTSDTTYTITAVNESGSIGEQVLVQVNRKPVAQISSDTTSGVVPLAVAFSSTGSTDPDGSIVGYEWDFESDGAIDSTQTAPTTSYSTGGVHVARLLVTDNKGASAEATMQVSVRPSAILLASPEQLESGSTSILSWETTGATFVTIDQGVGVVTGSGSTAIAPVADTTYTLTARNDAGETTATVSIDVVPQALPEGSFGKPYEDLVPSDAAVPSYDPDRFSVITGVVHDEAGVSLSGVTVSVRDDGAFGTVTTDDDGRYSLVLNGGTSACIRLEKTGYLAADRLVEVSWNDIEVVEDITLARVQESSEVFTFDGNSSTVQGITIGDGLGSNAGVTLVMTGDNGVTLTMPDGTTVESDTVRLKLTEYRTPDAMPAALPPQTGFTYCAELEVEGAESASFDESVTAYVDNFLDFEVGSLVPVGYYNREAAEWISSANGRVVAMIDTNADGAIDGIDGTGDGLADDFDESPRVSRRPRRLRGWGHEQTNQVPTGSARASRPDGLRTRAGVRVAVGCDTLDRGEVRHLTRDAPDMGQAG